MRRLRIGLGLGLGLRLPRLITSPGVGGGGDPGETVLAEARILIDWSDIENNGDRLARNQADPRPVTFNMLGAFPTGLIPNEGGSANPPRTNYFGGVTDPSGVTNNATRLLSSSTNQTNYFVRTTLSDQIANGAYGLRFRLRANAGTGPFSVDYGHAIGFGSFSAQDIDWSNPTNDAATTAERNMTFAGSGDFSMRLPASGTDIVYDRLQLYPGTVSSIPDWSVEEASQPGGRRAFAPVLNTTAEGYVDLTGCNSGLLAFDLAHPAAYTWDEYTDIVVCSLDAVPSSGAIILCQHRLDGGSTTGNNIICEASAGYAGEVCALAGTSSRADHAFNLAGKGLFLVGHARSATHRAVYFDEVLAMKEAKAFAGVTGSAFCLGSFANTNTADQRGNLALGDHAFYVRIPRGITDPAEWRSVAKAIKARMALRGAAPATWPDVHCFSGDSNWQRGDTTAIISLVSARDAMSPGPDVYSVVTAVGGEGLGNLLNGERNGWQTDNYEITDAGRWRTRDRHVLIGAQSMGIPSGYWPAVGTNDNQWTVADADEYLARYTALIDEALAVGPMVTVYLTAIIPRFAPADDAPTDAARLYVNAAWQAQAAASSGRIVYVDIDDGLVSGDYLSDGIHLNSSGDAKVAAKVKAAIAAKRATY